MSMVYIENRYVEKRAIIDFNALDDESTVNTVVQSLNQKLIINNFRTSIFAFNNKEYYFNYQGDKVLFQEGQVVEFIDNSLIRRVDIETMRVNSYKENISLATNVYPMDLISEVVELMPGDKNNLTGYYLALEGTLQGSNANLITLSQYLGDDILVNNVYPELSTISATYNDQNPNIYFGAIYIMRQAESNESVNGERLPEGFVQGYMPPKRYEEVEISDTVLGVIYSYADNTKPWLDEARGYGYAQPDEKGFYGVLLNAYDYHYSDDSSNYGEYQEAFNIAQMSFSDDQSPDYYKNDKYKDVSLYLPIQGSYGAEGEQGTYGMNFAVPNGAQVLIGFMEGNPGLPYVVGFTGINVFDQRPSKLIKVLDAIRDTYEAIGERYGEGSEYSISGTAADIRDKTVLHLIDGGRVPAITETDQFVIDEVEEVLASIGWATGGDEAMGYTTDPELYVLPEYRFASNSGSRFTFLTYKYSNAIMLSSKERELDLSGGITAGEDARVYANNAILYGGGLFSSNYISKYTPATYQQISLGGLRQNIIDYSAYISGGDSTNFFGYASAIPDALLSTYFTFYNDPLALMFSFSYYKYYYLQNEYEELGLIPAESTAPPPEEGSGESTESDNSITGEDPSELDGVDDLINSQIETLSVSPNFDVPHELGSDYIIRRILGMNYIYREGNTYNYYRDNDQYIKGNEEHIRFSESVSGKPTLNNKHLGRALFTGINTSYDRPKSYVEKTYMDEYYMVKGNSLCVTNGSREYELYGSYMLKVKGEAAFTLGPMNINLNNVASHADFKINTNIMIDNLMFGQRIEYTRGSWAKYSTMEVGFWMDDYLAIGPVVTIAHGVAYRVKRNAKGVPYVSKLPAGGNVIRFALVMMLDAILVGEIKEDLTSSSIFITDILGFIVKMLAMMVGLALCAASLVGAGVVAATLKAKKSLSPSTIVV